MKKVSIITVLNTVNYGSVLQTFATQMFWQKRGYQVEFVDYWRKDQLLRSRIRKVIFEEKKNLKQWIKKPFRDVLMVLSLYKNTKVFRKYLADNICKTSRRYYSFRELQAECPDADIFCTGSDQMWNSEWNKGVEPGFFLEYAPKGKKRIAFSTSIGKTEFEEKEAKAIIPLIQKYDYITLREQSAVELLGHYGIKARLVLDPTLMFDKEWWQKYIGRGMYDEPYLLVYQLHMKHENADFEWLVKELAKRIKLKIVRIVYDYTDRKVGKKVYFPKVEDFLSLICHAGYVVTDSFHGTAFSINFNRPFAAVFPNRFGTRMDNILKLLNLDDRKYFTGCDVGQLLENIDFDTVNEKLNRFRNQINAEFDNYLKGDYSDNYLD